MFSLLFVLRFSIFIDSFTGGNISRELICEAQQIAVEAINGREEQQKLN
jgi:hypothetical protein